MTILTIAIIWVMILVAIFGFLPLTEWKKYIRLKLKFSKPCLIKSRHLGDFLLE